MEEEQKKPRISNITIFLMVGTAIIFDVISIVPVVGQMIAVVGSAVVFGIWFLTLGLPLLTPKKLVTTSLSYLGEAIPAVSALPLITTGVILMVVFSRLEEKTGIDLTKRLAPTSAVSGTRQLKKDFRRIKNVDRTRQAAERLARMRDRGVSSGRAAAGGRQPMVDINPNTPSGEKSSMSIHDELWELNAKPNLSDEDKARLQKARWIMEHKHIEDKERNDPVLVRAFERASRGEVVFDGSPEKRHGFKFSNVQIVNATHTIAGRDFDSLNPQYGRGAKK